MIRRVLKKVRSAARDFVADKGVGYGVAEYDDLDRIRAEAHALDVAEGCLVEVDADLDAVADGTPEISAEDLRVMLEIEQGNHLPQLFDLRDEDAFAGGHIAGAERADPDDLLARIDPQRLVVLCADEGTAAIDGSYVLKRSGHTRVLALAGGLQAWERAGNAVEQSS
jgi:rhodanese-related sulfurtransferase